MNQLTLRGIPSDINRQLRQQSTRSSKSLNTVVIETIQKGLGLDGNKRKKRNLDRYSGTWTQEEYEHFEKSVQIFEQIDQEVWK